jgi:hypothetical protein
MVVEVTCFAVCNIAVQVSAVSLAHIAKFAMLLRSTLFVFPLLELALRTVVVALGRSFIQSSFVSVAPNVHSGIVQGHALCSLMHLCWSVNFAR